MILGSFDKWRNFINFATVAASTRNTTIFRFDNPTNPLSDITMKPIRFANFVIAFSCLFASISASAFDALVNGIYYNLDKKNHTATTTYKASRSKATTEYMGNITIPSEITWKGDTYKVTSIGYATFMNCKSLGTVTLPNTITKIEQSAFSDCSLTSIKLPQSVTEIEKYAFFNSPLTLLRIPFSVTSVSNDAFAMCKSLKQLQVPDKFKNTPFVFDAAATGGEIIYLSAADYATMMPLAEYLANQNIETWPEYYEKRAKKAQLRADREQISNNITADIERWQKKGEFEVTEKWQARVNEKTRAARIDSLVNAYKVQAPKNQKEYEEEYTELQEKYKKYYNEFIEAYYDAHIRKKTREFVSQKFSLNTPYDADNESFLINTSKYGDILLPVKRRDARSFKKNFASVASNVKPTFVPAGDDVALSKVEFRLGFTTYTYDSKTEAKYEIADIAYNFAPVDVQSVDFNIDDLNIAPIASNNKKKPVRTLAKDTGKALALRKVKVERNTIVAGNGGGGGSEATSDVDMNLPVSKTPRDLTVALVIANENYSREAPVPFAANDGRTFVKYLNQTLGVPEKQIVHITDASINDMEYGLGRLKDLCEVYGGKASVIIYYAGHGIPDDATKNAYLLPVDGYASNLKTCIALNDIYARLAALPARSTAVFLDACFSGSQRSGEMMANARGVKIKPKTSGVSGNMVVMSACTDDETAYPYNEKRHGLFTYFLLKKLKESKGNVTLGALFDYISTNVKQTSVLNDMKKQTPSVNPSQTIDWKNLKL